MRLRPDSADSSMCAILRSVCRICSAIGPRLRPPVAGPTGPMPERKIYSPTRMPGECGRLALRETLRFGLAGSITLRGSGSVMGPASLSSQGNAVDLDLVAADQCSAIDSSGRWIVREELAIDRIHVVAFQHRIDQHVDLHGFGERGAGCFQQLRHLGQNLPGLRGHCTVPPLVDCRVVCDYAGKEDEIARVDRVGQRTRRVLRGIDYLPR